MKMVVQLKTDVMLHIRLYKHAGELKQTAQRSLTATIGGTIVAVMAEVVARAGVCGCACAGWVNLCATWEFSK